MPEVTVKNSLDTLVASTANLISKKLSQEEFDQIVEGIELYLLKREKEIAFVKLNIVRNKMVKLGNQETNFTKKRFIASVVTELGKQITEADETEVKIGDSV